MSYKLVVEILKKPDLKKNIIYLFTIIILQTACKKEIKICDSTTELTDTKNTVDPSSIGSKLLMDSLAAHPELQVYQTHSDQYGWVAKCNIFYKGLKFFQNTFYYHGKNNTIVSYDTLDFSKVNFSLIPSLNFGDAIHIAKQEMNFDKTCTSYRLGFYASTKNMGNTMKLQTYKLAWKIQGDNGYPYVYVDANTGQVYEKFDGKVQ